MKKFVTLMVLVAFVGVAAEVPFDSQCDKCNNLVLNYKYVESTKCDSDLDVLACPMPCNPGATLDCPKVLCKRGCPKGYVFVNGSCPAPKTTKCPWYRINKAWARGFDNMCAAPAEVTQCAFMSSGSLPILGFVWGAGEGVFIGVARFMAGLFDCLTFGVANNSVYEGLGLIPTWEKSTWYKLPPVFKCNKQCEKPACPEK